MKSAPCKPHVNFPRSPLEFQVQSEVEVGELFHTVFNRRNEPQGFMGSMVVVAVQPVGCHVTHLLQAVEHVTVEHLGSVGLVESLDISILSGPSRLYSSMTLNVLKRRPDQRALDMKSQLQPWLG